MKKKIITKLILAATILTMSASLCACGNEVREEPPRTIEEDLEIGTNPGADIEVEVQVDPALVDVEVEVPTPDASVPSEKAIYASNISFITGDSAVLKAREYNSNADTGEVVNSELYDLPVKISTKQEAIEGSQLSESVQIKIDYDYTNWGLDYNAFHYHLLAFDGYTGTYIPLVDPAIGEGDPIEINFEYNGESANIMAVTQHYMADDYLSGYVIINAAVPKGYDGLCFVAFPSIDEEINADEDQRSYTTLDDCPQYKRALSDGSELVYYAYNPEAFK